MFLPLIWNVQKAADGHALLIGGWAVRFYATPPRPSSSELDFFIPTPDALLGVHRVFGPQVVYEWGSWVGFVKTDTGKRVRLDINPYDMLPMGVWTSVEGADTSILVGSPLSITSGKLARALRRGPLQRDQIDIAALLVSQHGELLVEQLKHQIRIDDNVARAFGALALPGSITSLFSPKEVDILATRVASIEQDG